MINKVQLSLRRERSAKAKASQSEAGFMNNISPEKKFNLNSVVLKEEEDPSLSIK